MAVGYGPVCPSCKASLRLWRRLRGRLVRRSFPFCYDFACPMCGQACHPQLSQHRGAGAALLLVAGALGFALALSWHAFFYLVIAIVLLVAAVVVCAGGVRWIPVEQAPPRRRKERLSDVLAVLAVFALLAAFGVLTRDWGSVGASAFGLSTGWLIVWARAKKRPAPAAQGPAAPPQPPGPNAS